MFGLKKRKKLEKLKKKIANLRKVRQEHIDDAAYWYCQGNVKQYNHCHARAVLASRQILRLRG